MNAFSDQSMTLAAIAPFAKTTTVIKNIEHIRLQESDRIEELENIVILEEETLDKEKYYCQADIFLYPSICQEAFGISIGSPARVPSLT